VLGWWFTAPNHIRYEARGVQQDANYNVTSLTSTSGTVVERYAYDPYGTPTAMQEDFTPESTDS
jgi:YD repeat-containing protein